MICSRSRKTTALLGVLLLYIGLLTCHGHEGPPEVIRRLTRDIDAGRGTAETFLARAIEYRILNKPSRAARDLRLATQADPDLVAVWRESAQVFLDLGNPVSAVHAARTALLKCDDDSRQARVCHLLLAQTLRSAGSSREALEVIDDAFLNWPEQDVDAYWLRSEILDELELQSQRLKCLSQGWESTGSEVLRIAWIEACIDLGRGAEVLPLIDGGLAGARLKASWRVRRARVLQIQGHDDEARAELRAALSELEMRINPQRPDPGVIRDHRRAFELLASFKVSAKRSTAEVSD